MQDSKKKFQVFLVVLILVTVFWALAWTDCTLAQDATFRRVSLSHGISIEIPNHWGIISPIDRQNIHAAGQSIAKNAGVEISQGKKETLLAVNATPNPAGSMIRVSITQPADFSQEELKSATRADLAEISEQMQTMFKKGEGQGGPKLLSRVTSRVEIVSGRHALALEYTRNSLTGASAWTVTQYKIPVKNGLIEMTLSHRNSDRYLWKPILERVKRSMQF